MAPTIRIPNLKEITSACVSVALWNHLDIPNILWIDNKNNEESPLIEYVLESIKKMKVPQSIAELLKTYVKKVKNELDRWVFHLCAEILHRGTKNELYCDIYKVIWYSDCSINYKATARNLLNSLRLSEIEKYHILCWYCLRDEINRLSPLLFTEKIVDHVDFDSDALIYYWNCYFRNELNKVPVEEGLSADVFMFRYDSLHWPAREYFFDQLNAEEQVQNLIWLLDANGTMYLYQKKLLMKLNEHQLQQVYINQAAQIIEKFMYTDDCYLEILPTWYDVRDLITQDQFADILTNLLGSLMHGGIPGAILTEIWTSAGDAFRSHILNDQQHAFFEKTLIWWKRAKDDSFLNTLLQYASTNLKREIMIGPFFGQFCQELIIFLELTKLERLFDVWSLGDHEMAQFKRNFTETEFFVEASENIFRLSVYNEEKGYLAKLEHLWNICFTNVDEVTRFKQEFMKNGFFLDACERALCHGDLLTLESFLNICLLDDGEFERSFAKNSILCEYCEEVIHCEDLKSLRQLLKVCFCDTDALTEFQNNIIKEAFFENKCRKLIKYEKLKFLKGLFNCCLSNTEEAATFKQNLVRDLVPEYYFDYDSGRSLQALNQFLNLCLPTSPESVQFMRDLVYDSVEFEYNYLICSWWMKLETANYWLMTLLMSQSNLVLEYKQNIWMSSSGIKQAVELFSIKSDTLNAIIADTFPDPDSADEFKRKIIFSSKITKKLQQSIFDGGKVFDEARKRIEGFLTSNGDQRTLKKQLIDNLRPKITEVFYKFGESGLQSLMQWCLEDKKAVQELKWQLPIDEIFERRLRECTFQTYDEYHRVSRSTLKKDFVFESVDRVLSWYFESSKKVKEYKVQKIEAYENIRTIDTLLKKNCHSSYMIKLMDWFFENDSVEMAKFKKKHKGEPFVNMIRICRESYFKNRCTL